MVATSDYGQHVVTRLFDFFTVNAQWQRRLWNTGLVLALRELDEAIEAHHLRVLTPEAVAWLAESIKRHVKDDFGVGSEVERGNLIRLLGGNLTFEGAPHRILRLFVKDVQEHYLARWEGALREPSPTASRERAARAIGAHLLDVGFSQQSVRDWLKGVLPDDPNQLDLGDLVAAARSLCDQRFEKVEILVLFERTPPGRSPRPAGWVGRRQARKWLDANGIGEARLSERAHGGILLTLKARDVYSAVAEAGAIADGLAARVPVGTRKDFQPLEEAFASGVPHGLPLRRSRRVAVPSLDRQKMLYDDRRGSPIDSALELLSPLDRGQGPVAVAGGWSAVEFLLRGPGDKSNVLAADRLAGLVACSWPRAELTAIALTRIDMVRDDLSTELVGLSTNRERCDRLLTEIRAGRPLKLSSRTDTAALHRVERMLANPVRFLAEIRGYAQECLRRLYRQRNLVLHGGRIRNVALDATLRTAAPLVGAGVDRIVHANLTASRSPMETAARAEFELQRAGLAESPELTALLE